MHHLIFIPAEHLTGQTVADQLTAVGLADHAQGALSVPCVGPAGSGTLFGWVHGKLHYNADEQEWFPAVVDDERAAGRYWVGVWKASPVTANDLQRPILHGDDVTLNDGQLWHVCAPDFLPHNLMLDDDGSIRLEPKRRYQEICLEARRWWRKLTNPDRQSLDYEPLWDFCVRCLGLNYRIPRELVSYWPPIGEPLIDEANIVDVLHVACRIREAE